MTKQDEHILFHTLGYNYNPQWYETRGDYRNFFGIYPSDEDSDYIRIKELVKDGFMEKGKNTPWGEEVYYVTDLGKEFVKNLWTKKKQENRPKKIGKRRYQAFLNHCDYFNGDFKEFLEWLQIPKKKNDGKYHDCSEIEEIIEIENFKKRYEI